MYICKKCGKIFNIPRCYNCGNEIRKVNNIYQLTDDPNKNLNKDKDMYIGYDEIGIYYSGEEYYKILPETEVLVEEIANIINDGIFLDLGCGDGFITVPLAKRKKKIIAADISNQMLNLLINKAKINNISLESVQIVRMNALDIPITDDSIDVVIANNLLHLISNPIKVINEIYRILKPNGIFIILSDAPGKTYNPKSEDEEKYINIVNEFYQRYWQIMKEQNILPKKYSWNFDKYEVCKKIFREMKTIYTKPCEYKGYYSIKTGFLDRMGGKGYSDQIDVPSSIHQDIYNKVYHEFIHKYGNEFENIGYEYSGNDSNIIDIFYK